MVEFSAADAARWDRYVVAHPRATVFHGAAWLRALATLPGRAHHLLALRPSGAGGTTAAREHVCGVLPLVLCRDLRLARGLYSLPHSAYGGPLADDAATEFRLIEAARELGARSGASRLELRYRHLPGVELQPLPGFVTFEKPLPRSGAELMLEFNKGARAAVLQARRYGLEVDREPDLDTFYGLLRSSYRLLGTPVYPRRFFAAILAEFGDDASILLVRHQGRAVAGVLALRFRDTILPVFTGEGDGARRLRANNFKFFSLMEWAIERGVRRFDFGRSRLSNPGVRAFKTHHGFTPTPLPYRLAHGAPESGADPNRGAFRAARILWRRLPAALTDRLGPALVPFFP